VRVHGQADAATLTRLQQGVTLEDGEAHFDRVVPSGSGDSGSHHWYAVTLREGRKREVRRLWEAVGLTVSRLLRVRYGPVSLGRELRRGAWRDLQPRELAALYKAVGMQAPEQAAPRRRRQRQRR
jgi:23S rRNA pseudouridine2605 synthase